SDRTEFCDGKLYIDHDFYQKSKEKSSIVKSVKVKIITPKDYNQYSETIMDVQPIAVKDGDSSIGSGITRVLDGVVMMVTGVDENGVQIGEFGSSEGILLDNIGWNRPGSPDMGDIIIKTEVVIKAGMNMERPGPLSAHTVTDILTQKIRSQLKELSINYFSKEESFRHYRRKGEKKILIVKEIMGQGAMHDNLILPNEPVGVIGAKANIDLGNLPVSLSPLEVLDGAIHSLTCIGPASKECSRHYFREPLILEALIDDKIDLAGVIFIGSPQINREKFYVSKRLGATVESMDIDGAIVTTEGFGNNHIDFANHIEEIGKRGIPVVGMTFSAQQGALVVGNPYMNMMVDLNKTAEGIENEILAYNTLCHEDGVRALGMLKSSMDGHKIL
ncbi:MAG: glycine/sarcosine/betaine reductase component B subunit, partial [Fusobacteriaceae bacterium]